MCNASKLPNADLNESFLTPDRRCRQRRVAASLSDEAAGLWFHGPRGEPRCTTSSVDHLLFNAKKLFFIRRNIPCYPTEKVSYCCTASGGFIFLQWCTLVHCILFFFYGGVRNQMQYSVNKVYTEINPMLDMWILSAVTVSCVKKKQQKKIVYIFYYMLAVVLWW